MTVSVAVTNVAQLFRLHAQEPDPTADAIFCRAMAGELTEKLTGKLQIPEYQRAYQWGSEQLLQLIDSIREHFSQPAANSPASPRVPYYLGSLILHRDGDALNIIDGQQRLTSLALMAHISEQFTRLELRYSSPVSHQQIERNLHWLEQEKNSWTELIDFEQLQFTLVIADNPDQAYHFFETHNTDGVRLKGEEIIKAHHLRAIAQLSPGDENPAAKKWEALRDLRYLIQLVMKGRFWQQIQRKDYPSVKNPIAVRNAIVAELAENTAAVAQGQGSSGDIGLANQTRLQQWSETAISTDQPLYDLRQPLNAGWNSLNYLHYFTQLKKRFLLAAPDDPQAPGHEDFHDFYRKLILKAEGCGFIKPLYDSALLLYISQFGDARLEVAAKKLFRVIYSRRVVNKVAVKESSIPSFISETPVLDWICVSFTPDQLFALLDDFELNVDATGLGAINDDGEFVPENSVKRRFIVQVKSYFGLSCPGEEDAQAYARNFAEALNQHIRSLPRKSKEASL